LTSMDASTNESTTGSTFYSNPSTDEITTDISQNQIFSSTTSMKDDRTSISILTSTLSSDVLSSIETDDKS
jgi:hypothetical protein